MLRDYQIDLINRVSKAWRDGYKAPCIVLPCGGGKSVIAASIAKKTTDNNKNVLFLVHRKELCEQIEKTFKKWGVNMSLCSVMMVQTASRRLNKIKKPSLIITDENHHSLANSYKKIYKFFDSTYRVGITATPIRLNGSGLCDVNDILIEGVSAKWLIDNNYLAKYSYYAPSFADLTGIKQNSTGDYDMTQTEEILIKKNIFGDVINCYKKLAENKKAICYCSTINYSLQMAEKFNASGISAAHIDAKTPKPERNKIINDFRKGSIKILCNVDLISEGFDVPDCECCILLRPTKSLTLYIQQSMRCMRYKKGKEAIIIDHVGNYARFGMPDDDRKWNLNAKKEDKELQNNKGNTEIKTCTKCYAVFSTFDENGKRREFCPICGAKLQRKERKEISQKECELQKITSFHLDYTSPSDCKNYTELLNFAKSRGYKKGWAYYQAKRRGML